MEQQLGEWLGHYGYIGIILALVGGIVGLPIPDEILMTFVGYNIFRGRMEYALALGCASFGSMAGVTVNYLLGRKLGLPFLRKFGPKFGINGKKIAYTRRLFRKFDAFLLFIGYFIPGARHLTPYLAGISKLRFYKFALYAYPGGLFWSFTFITLGWKLGERWSVFEHRMVEYKPYVLLFIACVILLIFLYVKFMRKPSS
ncbi:alkaline phosphatase [Aneurinibacillus migulanus]|uniref:DedA family protein n=1 Tax=Aneurinibacillus migulanus TaxID=47500 RepID=UPI0005B8C1AA|nr:DedA family protein [Aneurinibacillus migulanus]KIV56896.1 alkaline phosphatase [Aneurinibacillus migulanus]KPD09717.1 alkaline phosphatase [Aneurinibacillus migulanus]MCP1358655.1 DedA family protein [Aneurinibacillus migulanus]MED4730604.1 DedA family protein [Aneurinibacillus migulanus]CEH29066.1 SNARE-like domain protein [Aneurinibacillus migulanus]